MIRRDFIRNSSTGLFSALLPAGTAMAQPAPVPPAGPASATFDVRTYGAVGDGVTIDTPAVNRAIEAAAAKGGGTVFFPAGTYACYTIRLKSHVSLHLDAGATILAASIPNEGTKTGTVLSAAETWDNHEGDGRVTFQQWDGEKWKVVSDWIAPDWQLLRPIIEKSSEAYAKEKGIKLRTSDSAGN